MVCLLIIQVMVICLSDNQPFDFTTFVSEVIAVHCFWQVIPPTLTIYVAHLTQKHSRKRHSRELTYKYSSIYDIYIYSLRKPNWNENQDIIFTVKVQQFKKNPKWLQNQLLSAGLEPVLGNTEKSCIAAYYREFSTNIKIHISTSFASLVFRCHVVLI